MKITKQEVRTVNVNISLSEREALLLSLLAGELAPNYATELIQNGNKHQFLSKKVELGEVSTEEVNRLLGDLYKEIGRAINK
jgi:hypothetical protein